MSEQSLIAYLKLTDDDNGTASEQEELFKLQDRLKEAINAAGVGVFDGNALGGGFCEFYMYGSDADAIGRVVIPLLKQYKPKKGSHYQKVYGSAFDENTKEVEAPL